MSHTVLEKVTAKYISHSVNSIRCCFFLHIPVDLVVSRSFSLSHSQTLSRLITHKPSLPQCVTACCKLCEASLLLYNVVASPEILAAGTSHGRIAMWKMVVQPGGSRGDTKAQWKLQTPTEIEGNVIQLQVLSGLAFFFNRT